MYPIAYLVGDEMSFLLDSSGNFLITGRWNEKTVLTPFVVSFAEDGITSDSVQATQTSEFGVIDIRSADQSPRIKIVY